MSKIHYFQRYDQRENWVTNSTLLLLSRLYHYNRLKFERVINSILTESNLSLNIGVNFGQQERGKHSIVDGSISQDSFKMVIETKLYDNFTADQLKRHLDAFSGNQNEKILLALSKNKADTKLKNSVFKALQSKKYKGVKFATTSFENLIDTIRDTLAEHDIEMLEILEDYISLCQEEKLFNIENQTMLVFGASESFTENLKYGIYYDPVTRNHSLPFKFIGLYVNKSIRAIGQVTKIVYCEYEKGKLIPTNGTTLNLSREEHDRIKDTIEQTKYYDLKYGNKFYLVDAFHQTDFKKVSFQSLRGKRYFFLEEIDGFNDKLSAKEVAKLLDGKNWE